MRAGRKPTELAREFGCNVSGIHAWMRKSGGGAAAMPSITSDAPRWASERQELLELRRKFKQVQMERDILAKATAWFAGQSELAGREKTWIRSR